MRKDDRTGPLVCYLDGCRDSFLAAVVARMRFGDEAEYIAVKETSGIHAYGASHLLLLGCCGTRNEMEVLAAQSLSVEVVTNDSGAPMAMTGFDRANCQLVFGAGKSVGVMTWKHLLEGIKIPALVDHVAARELGHQLTDDGHAFTAALDSGATTLERWTSVATMDGAAMAEFLGRGAIMRETVEALRDSMIAGAVLSNLAGVKAMVVNAPLEFAKSVGLALAERTRCVGVVWQATGEGQVRVVLSAIAPIRVDGLCIAFEGHGTSHSGTFDLPLAAVHRLLSGELRPSDVKRFGGQEWRARNLPDRLTNAQLIRPAARPVTGDVERSIEPGLKAA